MASRSRKLDDSADLRTVISRHSNDDLREAESTMRPERDLRQVLAKRRKPDLQAPAGFGLQPIPISDDGTRKNVDRDIRPRHSPVRRTPERFAESRRRNERRSRSPIRRNSRSPIRRRVRSRSPRPRSKSPHRRRPRSKSPHRRRPRSKSPHRRRVRSRSPTIQQNRNSRSPIRTYQGSRSPIQTYQGSRSPNHLRPGSRSPIRNYRDSRSPIQLHPIHPSSRSPQHFNASLQMGRFETFDRSFSPEPGQRGYSPLGPIINPLTSGSILSSFEPITAEAWFGEESYRAVDYFSGPHLYPPSRSPSPLRRTFTEMGIETGRSNRSGYGSPGRSPRSRERRSPGARPSPRELISPGVRPRSRVRRSPRSRERRSPGATTWEPITQGVSPRSRELVSPRARSRELISPRSRVRRSPRSRERRSPGARPRSGEHRSPGVRSREDNIGSQSREKSRPLPIKSRLVLERSPNRVLNVSKPERQVVRRRQPTFAPPKKNKATEMKSVQFFIDAQRREIEALMRKQERQMTNAAAPKSTAGTAQTVVRTSKARQANESRIHEKFNDSDIEEVESGKQVPIVTASNDNEIEQENVTSTSNKVTIENAEKENFSLRIDFESCEEENNLSEKEGETGLNLSPVPVLMPQEECGEEDGDENAKNIFPLLLSTTSDERKVQLEYSSEGGSNSGIKVSVQLEPTLTEGKMSEINSISEQEVVEDEVHTVSDEEPGFEAESSADLRSFLNKNKIEQKSSMEECSNSERQVQLGPPEESQLSEIYEEEFDESEVYTVQEAEDEEPEDKAQNLDLRSFLNKRKRSNEPVDEVSRKTEKKIKESRREDDQSCVCCSAVGHTLKNCKDFVKIKPFQRLEVIANSSQTCKNCLDFGHNVAECPLSGQCLIEGCGQNHHTFLHKASEASGSQQPDQTQYIQDMLTKLRNQSHAESKGTTPPMRGNTMACVECGGDHNVLRCNKIPCDRCHENDHVSEDCKMFTIYVSCQLCHKRHRVTECMLEPCKNCLKTGHFVRICPEKKKTFVCYGCGGSHHIHFCPDAINSSSMEDSSETCQKCCRQGHSSANCSKMKDIGCFHCGGNHHIRFCPSRPCNNCGGTDHVTGLCNGYEIVTACSNCNGDHKIGSCPNATCEICDETGHLMHSCHFIDKFINCDSCQGRHKFANCPVQPCKICKKVGHTATACPTINTRTICNQCGENHHVHFCRKIPCRRCKATSHSTGECKKALNKIKICKLCGGNHLMNHCPKNPCKYCQKTDHITPECPMAKIKCRKCHETDHTVENCPDADKGVRCVKCHMFGHYIKSCPFLECENCGASGHWSKSCSNKKNEFRKRPPPHEESKIISIDYNHIKNDALNSRKPAALPVVKTKPLISHFYENLVAKGRNPGLAEQMILYWELANHNEGSLRSLFIRHSPCSRDSLRLILISELSRAPSSCRPMDITSSELLDATIDYFLPRIDSGGGETSIQHTMPSTSSNFSQLSNARKVVTDEGFDGRLKSLQPLQEFIAKKMRLLSTFFAIQEDYIATVSSSICTMLAQTGLCLYTLRRHFSTFGRELLADTIKEKMLTSTVTLPERCSSPYVVEIVTDFLSEDCER